MVPQLSQKLSKIDPGGGLEATWEPPLKQGASKTSCLMIVAPFWEPLWDQFGLMLGIIFFCFLKWLFDGLGLHLGSPNTSKMRPKRGSKPKAEIHRFCNYLLHFGYIQGCWKCSFFDAFLEPSFGLAFGTHFCHVDSLLGSILETILVTVWVQFLHRFLDPKKTSKNGGGPLPSRVSVVHAPPPRTPPT